MSDIVFDNVSVTITNQSSNLLHTLKSNFLYHLGELKSHTAQQQSILLNKCNGLIKHNKLTCILGGSGAGKSTLLNILTQRLTAQQNSHTLNIDGTVQYAENKQVLHKRDISYVPQQSILLSQLTVYETLYYHTKLLFPNLSHSEQLNHITTIIEQLHLTKCQHTRIGDEYIQGISGGERKRLNIALEILKQNSILICDEPTTGLDSAISLHVVCILKQLVQQNQMTCIASIHQPTASILQQFDELILLSKGKIIYCGSMSNVIPYFSELGYEYSNNENLADWLLDLTSVSIETSEHDIIRISMLHAAYLSHCKQQQLEQYTYSKEKVLHYVDISIHNSTMQCVDNNTKQTLQYNILLWLFQFYYLLHRSYTCVSRMPLLRCAQLATTVFMGLFIGLVFLNIQTDQTSIQNWLGSVYFVLICIIMSAAMGVTLIFVEERNVLLREQSNNMYSLSAYFISRQLVELPADCIAMTGFTLCIYYLIGYTASAEQYGQFYSILLLCVICGKGLGLIIACIVQNRASGMIIAPLSIAPFILFTNYALPDSVMPAYFITIRYISPFYWAFNALAYSVLHNQSFYCKDTELIQMPSSANTVAQYYCYMVNGDVVMTRFDIVNDGSTYIYAVAALIVISIVTRIIAFTLLKYCTK